MTWQINLQRAIRRMIENDLLQYGDEMRDYFIAMNSTIDKTEFIRELDLAFLRLGVPNKSTKRPMNKYQIAKAKKAEEKKRRRDAERDEAIAGALHRLENPDPPWFR